MGGDFMRLAYFALLLVAVGGYLVVEFRRSPGRTARMGLVWVFIFLGLVALAGLWPDIRNTISPRQQMLEGGRIEVPMGNDGHYHLEAEVNGTAIRFIVDTGASSIALTREDAQRIGIDPATLRYIGQAQTANGVIATAPVTLRSFAIGDIHDENVPAMVLESEMPGSLMGMTYLSRFARVSIANGRLVLER